MNKESISSENLNKEIAYLLGVYITDGSITSRLKPTPNCTFQLQVIDKDFAELTLKCLKKILPECKGNVNKTYFKPSGFCKKSIYKYCIGVGFTKWKDFFINQTGNKHHIPSIIWDAPLQIKKWFIAGVMDGDGHIAIATKGRKNPRFSIGIGGVEEGWIWEFKQFIEKLGIHTNKPEIIPAGYRNHTIPFVNIKFNVRDYIASGFFFTIGRKQEKLKKAIFILNNIVKERSTTRRCESQGIKI